MGLCMSNRRDLQAASQVTRLIKQTAQIVGSLLAVALTWAGLSGADAQSLSGPAGRTPAPSGASPRREMISLVALSSSHVDLSVQSLSKALDEIFPGKFVPLEQQANFVVRGRGPGQFLVKSTIPGAAGMFMVLSVPGPYTQFSDFARFIADASLRRRAEAQRCWLSIDLVHMMTNKDEAYHFIAVALAKLAPADAAVLFKPENNSTLLFTAELRSQLAAGKPP
jgi:hypothetical protein